MNASEERFDAEAEVHAVRLPVGNGEPGFTFGAADGGPGLTASVEASVRVSNYMDTVLDVVRGHGVEESQYEDLPELPRRRAERDEDTTYRVTVARVQIDTDAPEDSPEAFRVNLTDEAELRRDEERAAASERQGELNREEGRY